MADLNPVDSRFVTRLGLPSGPVGYRTSPGARLSNWAATGVLSRKNLRGSNGVFFVLHGKKRIDFGSLLKPVTVGMQALVDKRWIVLGSLAVACVAGPEPAVARQVEAFTNLSTSNGLSHAKVNGMAQDPGGFVWIASGRGLNRYDGTRMVRFDPDSEGLLAELPAGQTANRLAPVGAILADSSGSLWSATVTGLQRIDPRTFELTRYPYQFPDVPPVALQQSSDGNIWIAAWAEGLLELDVASGEYSHILLPGTVHDLHRAPEGKMWVATSTGLLAFNGHRSELAFRHDPNDIRSLRSDRVRAIAAGDDGVLWIGTERGLDRMDPEGPHNFEHIDLGPWTNLMITAVEVESASAVWVGTNRGVLRYDPTSGRSVYHEHSPLSLESVVNGRVTGILIARDGSVWVGSDRSGIGVTAWASSGLIRHSLSTGSDRRSLGLVTGFAERKTGEVLVGAAEGLFSFEPTTGALECLFTVDQLTGGAGINVLLERADGSVWIGTEGNGFGPVDLSAGIFRSMAAPGRNASFVYAMFEDGVGDLWVGTFGGLYRVRNGVIVEAFRQNQAGDLPSDWVTQIGADIEGNLWIASNVGVSRLDPNVRAFEHLGFGNNLDPGDPGVVTAMDLSEADRIWVTTAAEGLFAIDVDTGQGARYSLQDGSLESDELSGLSHGSDGAIWLQHPDGYMRFDPVRGVTTSWATDVGVLPYDVALGVSIASRTGVLLFGTQRGIVEIRPDRLQPSRDVPSSAVSMVRTSGVIRPLLRASPDGLIRVGGPVRPGDFPLTIHFSTLVYPHPRGLNLKYRLGDGTQLVSSGSDDLTFTTLPAGTNLVEAAFESLTGERGTSVRVEFSVIPPWYRSLWFLGLVAIWVVGLGVSGVRYRTVSVRRDNLRLENLVRLRTKELREYQDQLESQNEQLSKLDEFKTLFFVNISHDFRTPLTLILGPLQELVESAEGPAKRTFDRMHRNAMRLLRLINQVMDLARLEAGKLPLDLVDIDLAALLRQCHSAFEGVAQRRGLRFEVCSSEPEFRFGVDPVQFEKVILNLVSNAFKYTNDGGVIQIDLRREGAEAARISVRDSGHGIPADRVPHLFERFYMSGDRPGSGIGLALVRELVELHGGTVDVESRLGEGSVFTVIIPDAGPRAAHEIPLARPNVGSSFLFSLDIPDREPRTEASRDPRPTVLLVEDNQDLRAYLREHLDGAYAIIEAKDGEVGLQRAQEHIPDLIISDVMMPVIDGTQLLRALRADRRTSHIPIVLLTARADVESMIEGLETGADAYIAKPFVASVLSAQVSSLLAQRERLRIAFGRPYLLRPDQMGLNAVDERFLADIRGQIELNMADPDFGVEALATALNMSSRQLSRKLKALVNEGPGGFIRGARLAHAGRLLAEKSASVKEAAFAVGYRSQTQFSAQFKEQFGASPGAWDGGPLA
ncbi:MAG: signal transduction histidine kinase/ligand-binding sensor domain-containing protein [Rhodothermales bacterium]